MEILGLAKLMASFGRIYGKPRTHLQNPGDVFSKVWWSGF